jgi:hypothetical protein
MDQQDRRPIGYWLKHPDRLIEDTRSDARVGRSFETALASAQYRRSDSHNDCGPCRRFTAICGGRHDGRECSCR